MVRIFNFDHLKDWTLLFGNRTRLRLIFVLVQDSTAQYSVSTLARLIKEKTNSVRHELSILESGGLIVSFHGKDRKKYYQLSPSFYGWEDWRSLFNKKLIAHQTSLQTRWRRMLKLSLLILTGKFVGLSNVPVDVLIVGDLSAQQVKNIVKSLEELLGGETNYAHFTNKDFYYRYSVADQFIFRILDNKHTIVVDKFKLNNRPRVIK